MQGEQLAPGGADHGGVTQQLDELVTAGLRPLIGSSYDLAEIGRALAAIEGREHPGKLEMMQAMHGMQIA